MKKLIVAGDSYTGLHLVHGLGSPLNMTRDELWPALLSKKINMEVINLGQAGESNDFIFSKILDEILKTKNIGLVIVLWSEISRLGIPYNSELYSNRRWARIYFERNDKENIYIPFMRDSYIKIRPFYDPIFAENENIFPLSERVLRFFQLAYTLKEITKNLNINFLQAVGTKFCSFDSDFNAAKYILKYEKHYKINKSFIGYPMLQQIGGWVFDDLLGEIPNLRDPDTGFPDNKFRVGKIPQKGPNFFDSHPNKLGHQLIADKFYEEINKRNML